MRIRLTRPPGPPIVFVDGGARGARTHRLRKLFPDMRFIGFEPDASECETLNRDAPDGFQYFSVALARDAGVLTLNVTKNPACSSVLPPNARLLDRLMGLGPEFETVSTIDVTAASLDAFLPAHDIDYVDLLKLDTQGTELGILEGADQLLRTSILGLQVEVEFSPMYVDQPLFADLDQHLRAQGFSLFDLTRYRVRRARFPKASRTRGQLLWGQAFYLKDVEAVRSHSQRLRLAALAAVLDFGDYALEVLDTLVKEERDLLSPAEFHWAKQTRSQLRTAPTLTGLAELAHRVEHSRLAPLWRRLASAGKALAKISEDQERARTNVWKD